MASFVASLKSCIILWIYMWSDTDCTTKHEQKIFPNPITCRDQIFNFIKIHGFTLPRDLAKGISSSFCLVVQKNRDGLKKKGGKQKNSFCCFELIQEMNLPISYEKAAFFAVSVQRLRAHAKGSWLPPQSQKQSCQTHSPGRAVLKNVSCCYLHPYCCLDEYSLQTVNMGYAPLVLTYHPYIQTHRGFINLIM